MRITNQIFRNGQGEYITRCWVETRMWEEPTHPSQIRTQEPVGLYKFDKPTTPSGRGSTGATAGYKGGIDGKSRS